ncbi:MAG: D-alanyl-D-alanine carboxypeptidase family protein [Campylobacterales bacterium]
MKKIGLTVCLALGISAYAKTDIGSISSSIPVTSYIVKEVGSSEMLMAKNKDARIEPASLTKILTSIIAIESGRLSETVTIPREATLVEPSKAGFRPGDKISLLDLVKAAMVNSSNDAAFAIAIHLSGSVNEFARVMNYKARLLGAQNSNFTNPAGFDRGVYAGHYSTARDLLKLTEYAIKNRLFNEIAQLERVSVTEQDSGKVYNLKTHNRLLDKYKYAVGIKTGYTNRAGKCLIARAKKDNKDVLLVMLKAKADRWSVAEDMFEKAFDMKAPEPETVEDEKEVAVAEKQSVQKVSKRAAKGKARVVSKPNKSKIAKNGRVAKKAVKAKKRLKVAQKTRGDKS